MYENKFPEQDELVMVNVKQIADMGAYVHLLEYNDIEGMILLSELSRRRIRSIQKLIRVGRNEVVVVLRVDQDKGYIDLSKRRVSAEDVQKCEERFNKSKSVHSIMRHVAEKLDMSLEELYVKVAWPLYKKYGHAYDAFKIAINEPEKVFEGMNIEPLIYEKLLFNIRQRMTPQPVKIRSDLELTCFTYEGIDALVEALKAGEAMSTNEIEIKIKLVAAPLYVMTSQSLDKQLGIDTMEKALEKMTEVIKSKGGDLSVKMKPRAVSETDERQLHELMLKAEEENKEKPDDDYDSGAEEMNDF